MHMRMSRGFLLQVQAFMKLNLTYGGGLPMFEKRHRSSIFCFARLPLLSLQGCEYALGSSQLRHAPARS